MSKNRSSYKLVRDLIPAIIESQNKECVTRKITDPDKKLQALYDKLQEEILELKTAEPHEREAELADVLEVLLGLVIQYNLDTETLFETLYKKREERGAFDEFIELKGKW